MLRDFENQASCRRWWFAARSESPGQIRRLRTVTSTTAPSTCGDFSCCKLLGDIFFFLFFLPVKQRFRARDNLDQLFGDRA
jgi:hypothetical protein